MLHKRLYTILLALFTVAQAHSQRQAGKSYEFLDLPTTARSIAIGGNHAVLGTDDVGFCFQNPAALRDTLHQSVSINASFLPQGIIYGTGIYAQQVEGIGTFAAGVQYINYGQFDRTDEDRNELGTFGAQEAAIYLTASRQMTPWLRIGATVKPVFSHFDTYNSFGIAMDMGAYYTSPDGSLQAGLVIRNVGGQISSYDPDAQRKPLNTDIRIGAAYKLEHAPIRVTTTLKDIYHWKISTDNDNKISFGDNLMRHMLIGVEFMPIRNFFVGVGYDQRQRKETRSSASGGAAGFSFGCGLRVYKIDIAYGYRKYHLAGASNTISISTNLGRFL